MKIRTNFVTNSSSSSYISISITSGKLAEILKKYEELEEHFDYCDFSEDKCVLGGVDLDEYTPSELGNVMETLIEFLCSTVGCWLDEDEDDEDDDESLPKMIKELSGQQAELLASIEKVDWSCEAGSWGGDGDKRIYKSSYSEETLEKIYAEIAKEKGCPVEEITDDDFVEYAREKNGKESKQFTYSKDKGGKGQYTSSFELV